MDRIVVYSPLDNMRNDERTGSFFSEMGLKRLPPPTIRILIAEVNMITSTVLKNILEKYPFFFFLT